MEQCALARSVHLLECSREVWAAWESLLLPYQEGGGLDRVAVALIGLHLLAAEGEARSRGSQSPRVTRHVEARLSYVPGMDQVLGKRVVVRSRSNNNECWAIEVIGQDWSSEVVALFLEDWELGRVALSCHMAMDLLCQEMRDACWVSSESVGSRCSL